MNNIESFVKVNLNVEKTERQLTQRSAVRRDCTPHSRQNESHGAKLRLQRHPAQGQTVPGEQASLHESGHRENRERILH